MNASSYNKLHSIEVANQLFINREQMLSRLTPILQEHGDNKFGVCLVHRHCKLEEEEMMVADGNICQPERHAKDAYPERWLATGEAYEFNREPTTSPSEELLNKFRSVVGDVQVLGLFFIRDEAKGKVALERTEGRRNIVEFISHGTLRNAITTAWLPGFLAEGDGTTMRVYECSACKVVNGSHIQNANKMAELERRTDLGLQIDGLNGGGEVNVT